MGLVQDFLGYIRVARGRNAAARANDGSTANVPTRGNGYGDISVQNILNGSHGLSEEGSYFISSNPTPGTGIIIPMTAVLADTTPALAIQNSDGGLINAMRVYMDYIRLTLTAVGGGVPTDLQYAIFLDNQNRLGAAPGGTLLVPVNVNMDAASNIIKSVMNVYFGNLTALAKSNQARLIAQGNLRSIASVVKDTFQFNFGAIEKAIANSFALSTAAHIHQNVAPAVIGGQQTLLLYLWSTGETTTGKTFTIEIGSWER